MTEFEFLEPDFLDEDLRMVRDQVRRFSKERDARILTIGGGATEVRLEEVAKRM